MQHSMLGQKIILLRSIFDFVHDDLMVTDVSDSHLNTKSDNSLSVPEMFPWRLPSTKEEGIRFLHPSFTTGIVIRNLKGI